MLHQPIHKSLYGVEGGQAIVLDGFLYVATAEFTAPPHFVPSTIALWKAQMSQETQNDSWPHDWQRVASLFQSEGKVNCSSFRESLGSSVSVVFNETTNRFELFYVGFKSCNVNGVLEQSIDLL